MILRLLAIFLLLMPTALHAADDPRMQVELLADEQMPLSTLHADIRKAADLALPILWPRIVPQASLSQIPDRVKAIRFLLRATPNPNGISITFHAGRLIAWLEEQQIPYIAEPPAWNLAVRMINTSGRNMPESAAMLEQMADDSGSRWGYMTRQGSESLVMQWRWLDSSQIELTVRGTTKLGEFSETHPVGAGDPLRELEPWMQTILLRARDAYASNATVVEESSQPAESTTATATTAAQPFVVLTIERPASLPEQVLFEEELRRDPRITDLSLRQVNRDGQQYRVRLKDADDQWLALWFRQRGLTLTPTIEGWVAR